MSKFSRRPLERPAEILTAAIDVFFEKGFAASTLDEIARKAGVAKGTILFHYGTKKNLLLAAAQEFQKPLSEDIARKLEGFEPPYANAIPMLATFWREKIATSQNPKLAKIMFAEGNRFPELLVSLRDTLGDQVKAAFVGLLRRGVQSGEFICDDVELTARYLMGGIIFLEHWNETLGTFGKDPIDTLAYLAVWEMAARRLLTAKG